MPTSSTKTTSAKKAARKTVVKKAVKKAPAKKAAAKKVPKKAEFRALVCAIDGECFWSRDGQILRNLADLHLAFGSMDDEIFLHHVTGQKNDFADWVEYVLGDPSCAQALRKASKKDRAQKIVEMHLRNYSV